MAEYIECRNCDSPYCNGCNIHTLAMMLNNGKFDCLMGDDYSINPAADVVEVCRCKDCKYNIGTQGDFIECDYWLDIVKPNGFCSYGERGAE